MNRIIYVVYIVLLCVFFFSTSPKKKNSKYIFFEFGFYTFFLPMGYSSRSWSEMKRISCVLLV